MTNRKVQSEILNKLKVSRQALNQRAKRLKDKYGPMTTTDAVYIIGHIEGIDLAKYLPLDILDRIRSLIPKDVKPKPVLSKAILKKLNLTKKRKSAASYPLVSATFIKQVVIIGDEAFPQIVVLENSMRAFINHTLSAKRKDWWLSLVPSHVQKNVRRILEIEKKYPYREKRGNKPLMYCNFADLKDIVIANYLAFKNVIVDLEWFSAKMNEVYMARNNLAHSVLLTKDDMTRIALFYRDWSRLLDTAKIK